MDLAVSTSCYLGEDGHQPALTAVVYERTVLVTVTLYKTTVPLLHTNNLLWIVIHSFQIAVTFKSAKKSSCLDSWAIAYTIYSSVVKWHLLQLTVSCFSSVIIYLADDVLCDRCTELRDYFVQGDVRLAKQCMDFNDRRELNCGLDDVFFWRAVFAGLVTDIRDFIEPHGQHQQLLVLRLMNKHVADYHEYSTCIWCRPAWAIY